MSEATATPVIAPEQTHQVAEFKHESPLLACRFDPTGKFVFASAQDFSIQRWELASGKKTSLVGHGSWVWTLAFHPTAGTLYSGGYDGKLIFWEAAAETPTPARTIDAHNGWVRAVAVSPDGNLLATSGNDNLVKLWNAADGTLVDVLTGHAHHVYNVAFHPRLPIVVSGDLKGVIRAWDIATGEELRQFDAAALWKYDEGFGADIGGVRSMAFSGDGRHLACGGITEVSNAFAGIGTPLVVVFAGHHQKISRAGQRRVLSRHRIRRRLDHRARRRTLAVLEARQARGVLCAQAARLGSCHAPASRQRARRHRRTKRQRPGLADDGQGVTPTTARRAP